MVQELQEHRLKTMALAGDRMQATSTMTRNDVQALTAATGGVVCGFSYATVVYAGCAGQQPHGSPLADAEGPRDREVVKKNIAVALTFRVVGVIPSLASALALCCVFMLQEEGTFLVGLNGLRLLSDKLS